MMSRKPTIKDKDEAVEIDEKDLDQAAGGISSWSQPAESLETYRPPELMDSLDKVTADLKPDPSIAILSDPQKKI